MEEIKLYRIGDIAYMEGCQHVVKHSPTGIEWGYGGSGPADLALSILTWAVGEGKALQWYQDFKWDVILPMPREGGIITKDEVIEWCSHKTLSMN
jgi:hypothetical protein